MRTVLSPSRTLDSGAYLDLPCLSVQRHRNATVLSELFTQLRDKTPQLHEVLITTVQNSHSYRPTLGTRLSLLAGLENLKVTAYHVNGHSTNSIKVQLQA